MYITYLKCRKKCNNATNRATVMTAVHPILSNSDLLPKLPNKTAKQVRSVSICDDKSVVSNRVENDASLPQINQKTKK